MKEHAVVIAGGGPTGMMLGAELAIAGVDVAIVERRKDNELESQRAGGLHARTIEVLDQRGAADRFLSKGQAMQVAGFSYIKLDISDFPVRHNYGLALPQNISERIMGEWVSELPITFYREREVTGFVQDDTGVTLEVSDGSKLRAKYLVGCDGGRSTVRKTAGIDFPGWDASISYLIAEIEITEDPPWGMHRGERGTNAIAKSDVPTRARVVLVEPEVRKDTPSIDDVRHALTAVWGKDFGACNPTWISRFSDMARQAAKYRDRRVLLAGDAAHVHAPLGGQGLNIGVQDAVNLGWKLAQVVKGISPDALLDTYHAERHPVAARVLRLTLAQVALGRGDDRTEVLREFVSDMLAMEATRKKFAAMMSGLDIHYDLGEGHPLLGRRMPDLDLDVGRVYALLHEARPLLLDFGLGVTARTAEHVAARYEGAWELPVIGVVPSPRAVLVRPDGYVAWVSDGTDRGLAEALATWCGEA